MIEALGQAGGILAHRCGAFDSARQVMYLVAVTEAKFRKLVRPGDRLDLDVVPLRKGSKIWIMKGIARVGDDEVARAQFVASLGLKTTVSAEK